MNKLVNSYNHDNVDAWHILSFLALVASDRNSNSMKALVSLLGNNSYFMKEAGEYAGSNPILMRTIRDLQEDKPLNMLKNKRSESYYFAPVIQRIRGNKTMRKALEILTHADPNELNAMKTQFDAYGHPDTYYRQ